MITTAEQYNNMLWRIQDPNKPSAALLLPSEESVYDIDLATRTINAPQMLSIEKDHSAETIYFIVDRYYCGIDLANTSCIIQFINKGATPPIERYYPVPYYDVTTYSSEIVQGYIPIIVRAENYKPNKYYIQNEAQEYVLASGGYDPSFAYYAAVDQTPAADKKYIKAYVEYSNYVPNKYYILQDGEYVLSSEKSWDKNQSYYSYIDKPKIVFPWVIGGEATAAAGVIEFAIQFYILAEDGQTYSYCLNTKVAQSQILYGMDVTDVQNSVYPSETLEYLQQQISAIQKNDLYWIEVTN